MAVLASLTTDCISDSNGRSRALLQSNIFRPAEAVAWFTAGDGAWDWGCGLRLCHGRLSRLRSNGIQNKPATAMIEAVAHIGARDLRSGCGMDGRRSRAAIILPCRKGEGETRCSSASAL